MTPRRVPRDLADEEGGVLDVDASLAGRIQRECGRDTQPVWG